MEHEQFFLLVISDKPIDGECYLGDRRVRHLLTGKALVTSAACTGRKAWIELDDSSDGETIVVESQGGSISKAIAAGLEVILDDRRYVPKWIRDRLGNG